MTLLINLSDDYKLNKAFYNKDLMMDTPRFSELFDQYMIENGLTDSWMAWKIGVSRHTIMRWRHKNKNQAAIQYPSCDKLREAATILKLTPKQVWELLTAAHCQPEILSIPAICQPIKLANQFFGRKEVLERIKGAWTKPGGLENVAVIGQRGSGKTSLLHYFENMIETKQLFQSNQTTVWSNRRAKQFQFAIINFHDPGMCEPNILVREVVQQLKLTSPDSCDLICFSNLLKTQLKIPTIIMIDEIGAGLRAAKLDKAFWHNMRYFAGHIANLCFLVTSIEPIEKLAKNADKPSPFFNMFGQMLTLNAFTKNEAIEFIDHFILNGSIEDKAWILETSSGWPILLQILCDEYLWALEKEEIDDTWKIKGLKRIEVNGLQHLL